MSDETKTLSKSAQSVQPVLLEKGLAFDVIELSASTRTAIDAANTIGCFQRCSIANSGQNHCYQIGS